MPKSKSRKYAEKAVIEWAKGYGKPDEETGEIEAPPEYEIELLQRKPGRPKKEEQFFIHSECDDQNFIDAYYDLRTSGMIYEDAVTYLSKHLMPDGISLFITEDTAPEDQIAANQNYGGNYLIMGSGFKQNRTWSTDHIKAILTRIFKKNHEFAVKSAMEHCKITLEEAEESILETERKIAQYIRDCKKLK